MGLKGTDRVTLRSFLRDLTYNEIHLFWLGLYSGFVAVRPRARQEPNERTKRALKWPQNQWYWKTGYVLGYLLKAGVVAYLGVSGSVQLPLPLPS